MTGPLTPRERLSFSVLLEAFRLGTQTGRYSGYGRTRRSLLGARWGWNELLFRLGIGGVA